MSANRLVPDTSVHAGQFPRIANSGCLGKSNMRHLLNQKTTILAPRCWRVGTVHGVIIVGYRPPAPKTIVQMDQKPVMH